VILNNLKYQALSFENIVTPLIIIFLLFAMMNIIMRFTVFRMYGELRRKGVEISSNSFFNSAQLEEELKSYPNEADMVRKFVKRTRFAMTFASILISLVLIMGFILLRNR